MNRILTLLSAIFLATSVFAQAPEEMSYQAVIRDNKDKLLQNTQIGLQISILRDSEDGTVVYTETLAPTTNSNGLISIKIGSGITSDKFSAINWESGTFFIKLEYDLNGGSNYTITSTNQLLSVPYALHAKTAERIVGEVGDMNYYPQSGSKSNSVLVSFSGGAGTNFSQATPVVLKFEQATPIYPEQVRYVSSNKFDAKFYIPWDAATGTYDIIINPMENTPHIIEKAFLIDWFW